MTLLKDPAKIGHVGCEYGHGSFGHAKEEALELDLATGQAGGREDGSVVGSRFRARMYSGPIGPTHVTGKNARQNQKRSTVGLSFSRRRLADGGRLAAEDSVPDRPGEQWNDSGTILEKFWSYSDGSGANRGARPLSTVTGRGARLRTFLLLRLRGV